MNNPDSSLFHASEDSKSNLFERYWSSLPIRLKGVIVIALPMCALLFVSTANIFTDRKQLEADRAVGSMALAEVSAHDLSMALLNAETGAHEYALTGDPRFLRSYEAALAVYPSLVRVIDQTGHGAGNVAPVARNAFDAVKRVKSYDESRFPERGSEGLANLLIVERAAEEKLTLELGKLDADRSALIEKTRGKVSSLRRISRAADIFAIVVAIFGFILSTYLLNRVIITRITAAYEATQALAAGLPIPLRPGGKDEIGALIAGMRHASELLIEREQQLVAKNADLARSRQREGSVAAQIPISGKHVS